jgi:hypothetical protein
MDAMTKFALAIGKIKQDIENGDADADELGGAFEEYVGSLTSNKNAEAAAVRLLSAGQVVYGSADPSVTVGMDDWEDAVQFAEKKLGICKRRPYANGFGKMS